jgi:hypothetical protein
VATEPKELRTPRDVGEARDLLSRVFKVAPSELAALFGVNERALDQILQDAIDRSSSREDFINQYNRNSKTVPASKRAFFKPSSPESDAE